MTTEDDIIRKYDAEKYHVIVSEEQEQNKIRDKYEMRYEDESGKKVLVGKDIADGLNAIDQQKKRKETKLKEIDDRKLKELNDFKSHKGSTSQNKLKEIDMAEESTEIRVLQKQIEELKRAPKEREMEEYLRRINTDAEESKKEFQKFRDKDFKEMCHGIDCLKDDMKQLRNIIDKKIEKDNKTGEETCTGIGCLKKNMENVENSLKRFDNVENSLKRFDNVENSLKRFDNVENSLKRFDNVDHNIDNNFKKLDNVENSLKRLDLTICPECGDKSVPFLKSYCSNCGTKIHGWTDDKGEQVKEWKPSWQKIK